MKVPGLIATLAFLQSVVASSGSLAIDYSQPLATFNYSTSQAGCKNWIGIYNSYYGGPENETYVGNSLAWSYAPKRSGVVRVDVSKLGSGHFKAFFLEHDGYKWLSKPTEFTLLQGPVEFIVSNFTTHNARQGDMFEAALGGLVNNAGDERNTFTKKSGASWTTVSANGTVTGTPGASDESGSIVVNVSAADGSSSSLTVNIPIVPRGTPLVSTLKVMSFNLWHGGTQVDGYHRKQINFLATIGVDIVGVQESSGGHAIRLATALGWTYYQGPDVGIISRYPIVEIYPEVEAGGSVRIALDGDATQVIMWNAHLGYTPYGPYDFCYYNMTMDEVMKREESSGRTPQIKEIVSKMQIATADRTPVLLTGDFNAPSHLDWTDTNRDAHCGIGYVPWPSSIEPVKAGLVDTFREVYPDPVKEEGITWSPIYIYNDGEKAPEPLDRIDLVYYKSTKLKVVKSEKLVVGRPTAEPNHKKNEWTSDHAAMMTTFKFLNYNR